MQEDVDGLATMVQQGGTHLSAETQVKMILTWLSFLNVNPQKQKGHNDN